MTRSINKRSLKITLLGYFAAIAVMCTLLSIPIAFVVILKFVLGI